jgi:hypothetical protein
MRGNDYHFYRIASNNGKSVSLPDDLLGRQVAVVSFSPFTLRQGEQSWSAVEKTSPDGMPYFFLVTKSLTDGPVAVDTKNAVVAVSVLPCYMSVDAF